MIYHLHLLNYTSIPDTMHQTAVQYTAPTFFYFVFVKIILNSTMKHSKIKLLLVSSVFVDRGLERIILALYKHLPKEVYDIRILCLRNLSPYADHLNKNTDIKVDVIGMSNNFDIFSLYKFYQYIRKFKPDVINYHSFRAALWGRLIASCVKGPVILYSVHNKWGGAVHRFLDKALSRFTDAIVPFSIAVKNFIINDEKINEKHVEQPIYIGIDLDKFSAVNTNEIVSLRNELGIREGQNTIGFVGSIAEQKGLIYLVESIKDLKTGFPDICCLIIGDGPEKISLEEKIAEYNLENNFNFLGQRYDIYNLLNVMKIFVLPSLWEGLPQVIIEAMAASCPVIATDVDGTPEIITHKINGWLVQPANIGELTSAIDTLLSDNKLRDELTKNGYTTATDKFSVQTMANNYDNLYQTYLNRQS